MAQDMQMLKNEFEFFLANADELIQKYEGKFIAIKNAKVLGVYDTLIAAVQETSKTEELGSFLVQKCSFDSIKQTYHSRVIFN